MTPSIPPVVVIVKPASSLPTDTVPPPILHVAVERITFGAEL